MIKTRRLILIRHAKSGWDDPFADDHARTLTPRGHKAAIAIGNWLALNEYRPDVILSSDATRTAQTAQGVLSAFDPAPELKFVPALYHPSPDTICDVAAKEIAQTVAIISHNPGIGMCASDLVQRRPPHHRFGDYPTCATTVIAFPADQFAQRSKGIVVDFIVPSDLIDQ